MSGKFSSHSQTMITRKEINNFIIAVSVIILLYWLPFTRPVIRWLLPMGSGFDDLIQVAALVILSVYLIARAYYTFQKTEQFRMVNNHHNSKLKHIVIVVLAFISLIITSGSEVGATLLYGKPLSITTAIVIAAHTLTVAVLWIVASYFDRRNIK